MNYAWVEIHHFKGKKRIISALVYRQQFSTQTTKLQKPPHPNHQQSNIVTSRAKRRNFRSNKNSQNHRNRQTHDNRHNPNFEPALKWFEKERRGKR
jgi:hypothetical protein